MIESDEKFVFQKAPKYIESITEEMEAEWGKMSPQHMIEHLGVILLISGKRIEGHSLPKAKQEYYYKKLKTDSFEFKQNTKSPVLPDDLLPLRFQNLSKAKEAALKALRGFQQFFNENPEAKVEHPVFGELTYSEWLFFHKIHFKHHFRQFNLIG